MKERKVNYSRLIFNTMWLIPTVLGFFKSTNHIGGKITIGNATPGLEAYVFLMLVGTPITLGFLALMRLLYVYCEEFLDIEEEEE